jgi:hypothetical protein
LLIWPNRQIEAFSLNLSPISFANILVEGLVTFQARKIVEAIRVSHAALGQKY